jgi:hypothetical protein
MNEIKEVQLRRKLFQPIFDFFCDNTELPEYRVKQFTSDLIDVIIDNLDESNSKI